MRECQFSQTAAGSQQATFYEDFTFVGGGVINPLVLVYETHGQLNAQKDNVILVHHALSPSHHIGAHPQNPQAGWWQDMVGPGKALDTDRYFILCINNIGSCFGSSGPASINPATGRAYRLDFPSVTMEDMVNSQYLLLQQLGIEQCYAIIGNSMGGMISLSWAIQYPHSLQRLISISACYKAYPANMANRIVQRDIIQLDPAWQQGYYNENPQRGLQIARKLGHFTYRNAQDLNDKFANSTTANSQHEVESYLDYKATQFAAQYDVNCYLYFLQAMDTFDVTQTYAHPLDAFKRISAKVTVISVDSDILFIPQQQYELVDLLQQANVSTETIRHHSSFGHDAFLVETDLFSRYLRQSLQ